MKDQIAGAIGLSDGAGVSTLIKSYLFQIRYSLEKNKLSKYLRRNGITYCNLKIKLNIEIILGGLNTGVPQRLADLFNGFVVLMFGWRLQRGIILDSFDNKRSWIKVLKRRDFSRWIYVFVTHFYWFFDLFPPPVILAYIWLYVSIAHRRKHADEDQILLI